MDSVLLTFGRIIMATTANRTVKGCNRVSVATAKSGLYSSWLVNEMVTSLVSCGFWCEQSNKTGPRSVATAVFKIVSVKKRKVNWLFNSKSWNRTSREFNFETNYVNKVKQNGIHTTPPPPIFTYDMIIKYKSFEVYNLCPNIQRITPLTSRVPGEQPLGLPGSGGRSRTSLAERPPCARPCCTPGRPPLDSTSPCGPPAGSRRRTRGTETGSSPPCLGPRSCWTPSCTQGPERRRRPCLQHRHGYCYSYKWQDTITNVTEPDDVMLD